jgi:hypothetical protein
VKATRWSLKKSQRERRTFLIVAIIGVANIIWLLPASTVWIFLEGLRTLGYRVTTGSTLETISDFLVRSYFSLPIWLIAVLAAITALAIWLGVRNVGYYYRRYYNPHVTRPQKPVNFTVRTVH